MPAFVRVILQILRKVLSAIFNKDFILFVFFLILSASFWLGLKLNDVTEQDVCVPVQLNGLSSNAIITTPLPDTIVVTVRDKGYAMLTYAYGEPVKPIIIDFKTYANQKTGRGSVPMSDVVKLVSRRLHGSSTISTVKPDKLEFFFSYGNSKRVPVKFNGDVKPISDHYLADVRFWPKTVTVYANDNQLDSIDAVYTEHVTVTGVVDTLFQTVGLARTKGVKVMPDKVQVGFYTDILTEASIEVPITTVNMPKGKVLRTFPSKVKVKFTVGANRYKDVKAKDFRVVVDYDNIANHPSDKCGVRLLSFPAFVSLARVETEQVDYLVEQQ